ncbi:MAG: class I SAM-dependent methyltransferase [Oscillospiraceae bacterium]
MLDCGCGGGANIKTLLKKCPQGIVNGIDYSDVSVEWARKLNQSAIACGRCTVQQGDVSELGFKGAQFDLVTGFETVYFWPGLRAASERCSGSQTGRALHLQREQRRHR